MNIPKFRGKRIDNGEWVYGYFVEDSFDTIWSHNDDDFLTQYKYIVDANTVSRFTGLYGCKPYQNPYTEETKQEAYYGDIIRFTDTEGNEHIKELWWNNDLQCTMVGELTYLQLHESGFIQPSKLAFQIIGNVYDNLELLKEKEYVRPYKCYLGKETKLMEDFYVAGAKEVLASQWKDVNNEKPSDGDDVVACLMNGRMKVLRYRANSFYDEVGLGEQVKYWMPIPELLITT